MALSLSSLNKSKVNLQTVTNAPIFDFFLGISRVEFDEIIPLKLYFQEDHLSNIRASPTTITEDFCGKFRNNT